VNHHGQLPDERDTRARFGRRAWIGFAVILALMAAVAGRFVYLQVYQHNEYSTRAKANRVRLKHLPPPRGLIYDRHGKLLANNLPAFRLDVTPDKVSRMDQMLQRLARVVPLSRQEIHRFRQSLKNYRPFNPVPLKFHLTESERDRFAVNQWKFPGVSIDPYLTRNYPYGAALAHVVGYVGRIDPEEAKHIDPDRYAGTTHIGKTGIEKQYEKRLHGTPGYELVEVNADQRPLQVLKRVPARPGANLYLTLDARLQKATIAAFAGRPGAAVAIDPRNGNILAMVTVPSYDPNLFVNGISQSDYAALLDNPDKPLLNRAMRGGDPPGSTVKPFLGLGGLELGLRTPATTVLSTGTWYIPGSTPGVSRGYRDDRRGGAGRVNVVEAIARSVNTYFYSLAYKMGMGRFDQWMAKFGFGKPTGIDLPGETGGVLPSPAWKQHTFHKPWYPGETVISGIGQGYWMVTPLQMAHAVATLADGGQAHTPHLLAATRDGSKAAPVPSAQPPPTQVVGHDAAALAAVRQGMLGAVYNPHGTAYGLGEGFPYRIAGKTGTAERYSRHTRAYNNDRNHKYLARRHRAWFICYTPAEHPQIAIAVLVEHGAWGSSTAAPIARKMLNQWLADTPPSARPPLPITAAVRSRAPATP
jgi:penicillin-binding protein 2